jgi:hypothetical protein
MVKPDGLDIQEKLEQQVSVERLGRLVIQEKRVILDYQEIQVFLDIQVNLGLLV